MTHLVRKGGIPVLAYPKCDASSPVSCSLVIRCNDSAAQATLCISSSLLIEGFNDWQTFIMQYDADNLVSGSISLGPATIALHQTQLDEVARHGNPQIRTLSLALKKQCPLWRPVATGSIAPQYGFDVEFQHLGELAKATELDILFDYNWLHRDARPSFQRIIAHPEELSGFPVARQYRNQYRCLDWSVFNLRGAERLETHATTEDKEPPPPYAEASSKRPRHVSTSPTRYSPSPKRVLLSPLPDYIPASPTEKNTPSPKPPSYAPSTPKAPYSPIANPADTKPSYSPTAPIPNLQRALEQAISTLLPSMLESMLPSLLTRILAAPSSASPTSSPASQHSFASQISHAPPAPALSALGITLGDHVARKVEGELASIYAHTLSHATYLRNVADAEFEDVREEEKLQLRIDKEDAVAELERAADAKLDEFCEKAEGVGEGVLERVGWRADEILDGARGRLDGLEREKDLLRLKGEREECSRDRKWLGWEREVLRRDRRAFEDEKRREGRGCERAKRSGSAPV